MKRLKLILECLTVKIKKKFFKYEKNDKSHVCESWHNKENTPCTWEEKKQIEEYVLKYAATTRWQTI